MEALLVAGFVLACLQVACCHPHFICVVTFLLFAQILTLALYLPLDAGSPHKLFFPTYMFYDTLYLSPWVLSHYLALFPELGCGLRIFLNSILKEADKVTRFKGTETYLLSWLLVQTLIFISSLDPLIGFFFPILSIFFSVLHSSSITGGGDKKEDSNN